MINDFSSSEDSERGQKVVQKPVNIWGSLYTQVRSPKETHDIPPESKDGFQTSLTDSRLSFRIAEKKGQHFIRIGGEKFL